ncbi:MAG: DUF4411 family protein [Candidatus Paceibacterota bacterium]
MIVPNDKKYIIDTNVLFGFSKWIPINLNKFFWDRLENSLREGKWILLDVVVDEIKYDLELKKWCKKQKRNGILKSITDNHRNRAVEINNIYKMIGENGKSTIDTYLIAYAEDNDLAIFSMESFQVKENSLLKIPDVCQKLHIPVIKRPVKFLETIGFKN